MPASLNILIVEDSQNDADLVLRELHHAGFDPKWKRVETETDFLAEIKNSPDIVLSDYSLPRFSGLQAAKLLQQSRLDIPFILISGTVGEDVAVEAMKCGATDYLLKDRITRLGGAVENALEQKRLRDERRQTEDELRWKTAFLSAQLDSSPDAILAVDDRGKKILQNKQLLQVFKVPNQIIYDNDDAKLFQHVTDQIKDPKQFNERVAYLYAHPDEIGRDEIELADGRVLDRYSAPVRDGTGKYYGRIWSFRDITERKLAEIELRQMHRRYELILNSVAEGIHGVDLQGNITFENAAAVKMFGWDINELVGKRAHEVMHHTHADGSPYPVEQCPIYTTMRDGVTRYVDDEVFWRKDGTSFSVEYTTAPKRGDNGEIEGAVMAFRDITERKKMEEQFRQSQKMEGIGQLASGVAHDFNNILAIIQMQSELMKMKGGLSPEQFEFATEIGVAAQRAAALTRQLLLFSRKEKMQTRELDLNQSVNDMTKMLRRTIGADIQLQFKFAMQPLFIQADAGMMDQVLMNLAVNARDAMTGGGKIVIEISAEKFDETAASHSAQVRPGEFVCLSVSDTGCGIPPENLKRIFEPFFTTKEVGKGTGLGLATVFGIVEQHKGWVNVQSEVGQGTTLRIYIPRLARISDQKFVQPATEPSRGVGETILLVEDESSLRASMRKALSHLGYNVLEAVNGVEAFQIWKQNRGTIHLVLTDMIMPGGINGKELGELLLQDNPQLKIIYVSGYSAEVSGKDFPLKEGVNFLTKPFQAQKLAQTIRENLDAR